MRTYFTGIIFILVPRVKNFPINFLVENRIVIVKFAKKSINL